MAQTKMVQIESKRQVRYTTEVVDGNTVRVETASPQIREKELRRTQVEQNRQRALSMNLHYVLFMTIAAVAVVTICIFYLRLQATSTKLQKRTVNLQTQLKNLQIENDIVYNEIISGVDLEHVREVATEELGMTYPAQSQIVSYSAVSSDYVKQYEEIPD